MAGAVIDRTASTLALGTRVAYARELRNMTMAMVARRGGLASSIVSTTARSRVQVRLLTLHRLARGLDVPVGWLLELGDITEPSSWAPPFAEDPRVEFGRRLRIAREWRGLRRPDAGVLCGLGPDREGAGSHMCILETAREQPEVLTIQRLATGLDVPAGWLAGEGMVRTPWDD